MDREDIKFTVITVCYNSEKTIQRTLQSIKDQTYKNIEYIIIDGGSTDKTLEIISNYIDIVNILVSEPDNGIYDAMNKGIKLATGDYIGFLNSDDYYTNDIFEEYSKLLISKHYDFVYSDTIYYDDNESWTYECNNPKEERFIKFLDKGTQFCHQTLYVNKFIFEEIGIFDERFRISADYDFSLRLFKTTGKTGIYLPTTTCYFYIGGISSHFFKTRLDEVRVRLNNGYSMINSLYIFLKLCFFYYLQKIPFMKKVKRIIKKEKVIR
ncbi:glycosyltransferase family 2 protein [Francisella philomiragia]|uniref:glycosyltransferase family 2 protein n=1 Tax=Francisella philomiragia TaxID=28110 RepID=UPI003514449A